MHFLTDPRVRRGLLWLWCVAWLGVAFAMLSPHATPPLELDDKSAHSLGYALMSASGALTAPGARRFRLLLALALALSALLELGQIFVPSRSFELADLAANGLGIAIGGLVGLVWLQLVYRGRSPANVPA